MEKININNWSDEKIGQVFPILLLDYNPEWRNIFKKESETIFKQLKKLLSVKIFHVGSTAIPGITSKPTIDIILEIEKETNLDLLSSLLEELKYKKVKQANMPEPSLMFAKGYSPGLTKTQTFHLHVRFPSIHKECIFRDILIQHPELIAKYEKLKIALARKYKYNREKYTDGKKELISEILSNYRQ